MDTDESGNIMITNIIDEIIDNVVSQNTEMETDKLEGRSTNLREMEKGIQKVGVSKNLFILIHTCMMHEHKQARHNSS